MTRSSKLRLDHVSRKTHLDHQRGVVEVFNAMINPVDRAVGSAAHFAESLVEGEGDLQESLLVRAE